MERDLVRGARQAEYPGRGGRYGLRGLRWGIAIMLSYRVGFPKRHEITRGCHCLFRFHREGGGESWKR